MGQTPQKEDCDIFEDSEGRDTKHKIVRSMRGETILNSMSKVLAFGAGPVFGAGMVMGIGKAAVAMAATHGALGGVLMAGVTAFGGVAAGIVAVGALMMVAATVADFVSTRVYQDKQLDMQEFNAKRAGHHIVHELKAQNMCLTTEKDSPCAQKKWAENMAPRGQQENWSNTIEAQRQQAELAAATPSGRA